MMKWYENPGWCAEIPQLLTNGFMESTSGWELSGASYVLTSEATLPSELRTLIPPKFGERSLFVPGSTKSTVVATQTVVMQRSPVIRPAMSDHFTVGFCGVTSGENGATIRVELMAATKKFAASGEARITFQQVSTSQIVQTGSGDFLDKPTTPTTATFRISVLSGKDDSLLDALWLNHRTLRYPG